MPQTQPPSDPKFCSNCGGEFDPPNLVKFCVGCGAAIPRIRGMVENIKDRKAERSFLIGGLSLEESGDGFMIALP